MTNRFFEHRRFPPCRGMSAILHRIFQAIDLPLSRQKAIFAIKTIMNKYTVEKLHTVHTPGLQQDSGNGGGC